MTTPEGQAPAGGCRVCGNASCSKTQRAREMFLGTRDPFDYVECAACGTVQIGRVVAGFPEYLKDAPLPLHLSKGSAVLDVGAGAGASSVPPREFGFRD